MSKSQALYAGIAATVLSMLLGLDVMNQIALAAQIGIGIAGLNALARKLVAA